MTDRYDKAGDLVDNLADEQGYEAIHCIIACCVGWAVAHGHREAIKGDLSAAMNLADKCMADLRRQMN